MTDLMLDEPNDYKIFCSWKIHRFMSCSKLLHVSLKEILMCEKQSLSAFTQFARLFDKSQFFCLFLARQPPVGHGLLIHEVSRLHTTTHHRR